MKALIIVDIQNDFLSNGSLPVEDGELIIPIINKIQDKFDLIVASLDWHPKCHKSFANNHKNKRLFDEIVLNGINQVLWPKHCVQGSFGADFSKELNQNKISTIFRKGINKEFDSYSAFYDNGNNSTGLLGYLKDRQVEEVYVCGLAADYCVYYTALDSLKSGFKTYYIEDATKAISLNNYRIIKEDLISKKIIFINHENIK